MPVVLNPESEIAKELAKWEKPYRFEPFPAMVYKAFMRDNGQVMCGDNPLMHGGAIASLEAEAFTKQCQRIVRSEGELSRAWDEGWRTTPGAALEHYEQLQQSIAQAAAEAAFAIQRMTALAQAEYKAAELQTSEHVVDVVKAKRGRPAKAVTGSGEQE